MDAKTRQQAEQLLRSGDVKAAILLVHKLLERVNGRLELHSGCSSFLPMLLNVGWSFRDPNGNWKLVQQQFTSAVESGSHFAVESLIKRHLVMVSLDAVVEVATNHRGEEGMILLPIQLREELLADENLALAGGAQKHAHFDVRTLDLLTKSGLSNGMVLGVPFAFSNVDNITFVKTA